jgi:hypothetical protein
MPVVHQRVSQSPSGRYKNRWSELHPLANHMASSLIGDSLVVKS